MSRGVYQRVLTNGGEACEVNAGLVPQQGITVVADEIFAEPGPHLVVVEPHSLLILELSRQEKRDSLTWGITLLDCATRGVEMQTLVSDAAQGLKQGITEAELGIEHQLDLFHTLGEVMRVERQLEREAYKAIGEESERARVVVSARSERVSPKRLLQWVEAAETMEQKIEVYEIYAWLVSQLREGLEFVSAQSGALQPKEAMSALIGVVSELMLTILKK